MPKVLVIDDSHMMRLYLRRALEKNGYDVEDWHPTCVTETLDRIHASRPDLLLTDFSMAGCNGATVVRLARKAHPHLPSIVLTAFKSEEVESNLLRLGVRRVCTKPISPEALVQAIQDTLQEGRTAHA